MCLTKYFVRVRTGIVSSCYATRVYAYIRRNIDINIIDIITNIYHTVSNCTGRQILFIFDFAFSAR